MYVKIKDIAESLNVSPTTVSNVIHGNLKKVSPQKANLIRTRLQELNYIPNMNAHTLAGSKSKMIGVILNSADDSADRRDKYTLHSNPFNSTILSTLEEEIRLNGYYMMFYVSQEMQEILNVIKGWNIDGLIVWGVDQTATDFQKQCATLSRLAKIPVVFIDSYCNNEDPYDYIGLDDLRGGYIPTRYLIENGHRNIAFASDFLPLYGIRKLRFAGYRKALEEAHIPWRENLLIQTSREKELRVECYNRIAQSIDQYTAIFFDADYYAVEAMGYLMDAGIRIPEDISIIGFDDNSFARIIRPRLTTIRQDVPLKAKKAVERLLELIENPDLPPKGIVLPVELIVRNSVRNILCK